MAPMQPQYNIVYQELIESIHVVTVAAHIVQLKAALFFFHIEREKHKHPTLRLSYFCACVNYHL